MISSVSNNRVKYVRRLQTDRRFRAREGVFVAEGTRWLADLVAVDHRCEQIFVTASWQELPENSAILQQMAAPVQVVSDEVMAAMSDTQTPQGVLAVVGWPQRPFPPSPHLLLILDAINNPGNLGTMLRTAAAAGVDGVILAPGCVDAANPKVVRGSMGALLRVPVVSLDWSQIGEITAGMAVWLAAVDEGDGYTAVYWNRPSALIIGSEASGAGAAARHLATGHVTIPMHAATESLNAAIAAAVILFEAMRQRNL